MKEHEETAASHNTPKAVEVEMKPGLTPPQTSVSKSTPALAKSVKDDQEVDIFIKNRIYQDAKGLFAFDPKSLKDIKNTCLVVPDTSALLLAYDATSRSLSEIAKLYEFLTKEKRLRITGQVAREFVTRRADKMMAPLQSYSKLNSQINNLAPTHYPFLESLPEYQSLVALGENVKKQISEYSTALNKLIDHVRGWYWNDPVTALYRKYFTPEIIIDPAIDDEVRKEHLHRYANRIPPGYKDGAKLDEGIGDYLIWLTICQIGQQEKKPILFASGEEKADWMHRLNKEPVYPRFELVDEFRRASEGASFHLVQLSRLLDLFGVEKAAVDEVHSLEEKARVNQQLEEKAKAKAREDQTNAAFFVPVVDSPYQQLKRGPLKIGEGARYASGLIVQTGDVVQARDEGVSFLVDPPQPTTTSIIFPAPPLKPGTGYHPTSG